MILTKQPALVEAAAAPAAAVGDAAAGAALAGRALRSGQSAFADANEDNV